MQARSNFRCWPRYDMDIERKRKLHQLQQFKLVAKLRAGPHLHRNHVWRQSHTPAAAREHQISLSKRPNTSQQAWQTTYPSQPSLCPCGWGTWHIKRKAMLIYSEKLQDAKTYGLYHLQTTLIRENRCTVRGHSSTLAHRGLLAHTSSAWQNIHED